MPGPCVEDTCSIVVDDPVGVPNGAFRANVQLPIIGDGTTEGDIDCSTAAGGLRTVITVETDGTLISEANAQDLTAGQSYTLKTDDNLLVWNQSGIDLPSQIAVLWDVEFLASEAGLPTNDGLWAFTVQPEHRFQDTADGASPSGGGWGAWTNSSATGNGSDFSGYGATRSVDRGNWVLGNELEAKVIGPGVSRWYQARVTVDCAIGEVSVVKTSIGMTAYGVTARLGHAGTV